MSRLLRYFPLLVVFMGPHLAAAEISGWVTDAKWATYEYPTPGPPTGSAHLPAVVRATVDEHEIAVVGWDIYTPERDEGLLSMLLSTTWTSPMKPWPGSDEWFVSSYTMPISEGGEWSLWYRDLGAGRFELGAPPFLDPAELPQYTITDQRQRQWSFSQPLLVIPEPTTLALALWLIGGGVVYGRHRRMVTP